MSAGGILSLRRDETLMDADGKAQAEELECAGACRK